MTESDPQPVGQPAPDPAAQPGSSPSAGGPAGSPREAVRLLVKAVGMLPDGERDEVYTWLLSRGLASAYGTGHLPARLRDVSTQILSLQAARGPSGPQQVVPVRFAAEQHAQLRAWCAEHGFSMATVVRGLVARFLEGQLPARN
ncbi:MAG: plasmid partition protein ParG [Streptosporangiaceae bacterium]